MYAFVHGKYIKCMFVVLMVQNNANKLVGFEIL